jgi:hypothetical protein
MFPGRIHERGQIRQVVLTIRIDLYHVCIPARPGMSKTGDASRSLAAVPVVVKDLDQGIRLTDTLQFVRCCRVAAVVHQDAGQGGCAQLVRHHDKVPAMIVDRGKKTGMKIHGASTTRPDE